MGERKRLYYLDVLRVIACIMIIIIHVSSVYIYMGESVVGNSYIVGLVANTMSRSCIGLFLMISGALVLKKSTSPSNVVKHSIKYLYLYFLWSFLYSLVSIVYMGDYSVENIVGSMLRGKYHLWYLLLISFIYGIIPLFKSIDIKSLKWVCFICILFGVVFPSLNFGDWSLFENAVNSKILAYIGYFILGYLLSRAKGSFIFILPLVVVWVFHSDMMVRLCRRDGVFNEYLSDYNNILVFIEVVCIFLIVKYIITKGSRVIEIVSGATFGVYLIHVVFVDAFRSFGLFERLPVLVAALLIFLISFCVSWLIGFIKPLKWLIF